MRRNVADTYGIFIDLIKKMQLSLSLSFVPGPVEDRSD